MFLFKLSRIKYIAFFNRQTAKTRTETAVATYSMLITFLQEVMCAMSGHIARTGSKLLQRHQNMTG